jgi:hypothetical protein
LPLSAQTTAGSSGTQQQLSNLPRPGFSAACQDGDCVETDAYSAYWVPSASLVC